MGNLNDVFMRHCERSLDSDACFQFIEDVIRTAKNNRRLRFKPPEYLGRTIPKHWVYVAKKRFGGSLEKAWIAHLENCKHLYKLAESNAMQPGDIAISRSGKVYVNGMLQPPGFEPVIGVISTSYELVSRTNFGLAIVSPPGHVWRIK